MPFGCLCTKVGLVMAKNELASLLSFNMIKLGSTFPKPGSLCIQEEWDFILYTVACAM